MQINILLAENNLVNLFDLFTLVAEVFKGLHNRNMRDKII